MIRNSTPEWYEARRQGVTSTDIVCILGLDRWRSEGDVAREKMGITQLPRDDPDRDRMLRLGKGLESVIQVEEEIEHGVKLRRINRLIVHSTIPWAMTSGDFERVGERCIVEVKVSASKMWDDGLPEAVEAQVRWQMGVAGYPRAHVAALRYGRSLACFDVDHDPATFDRMVAIADDFRRRVEAGGPFEESKSSVRRAFPLDDGSSMVADAELAAAVAELVGTRKSLKTLAEKADALQASIQTKMADASLLVAPGYRVTWRRTKDGTVIRWDELAERLLQSHPDELRAAIIGRHTYTRPGFRRFVVREERTGND